MMLAENQSRPGVWRQTGQCKTTCNYRADDLEAQLERACAFLFHWDGTTTLPGHGLRQWERDRDNRAWITGFPDLAVEVYERLHIWTRDADVRVAWRRCQRWTSRTVLGLDEPRRATPVPLSAVVLRDLTAAAIRQAVGA